MLDDGRGHAAPGSSHPRIGLAQRIDSPDLQERGGSGSIKVFSREVPISQVIQEGGDVIITSVLVIQIIGVLPDIDGQKGFLPVAEGIIRIDRLDYLEIFSILNEPRPTATKKGCCCLCELIRKVFETPE